MPRNRSGEIAPRTILFCLRINGRIRRVKKKNVKGRQANSGKGNTRVKYKPYLNNNTQIWLKIALIRLHKITIH